MRSSDRDKLLIIFMQLCATLYISNVLEEFVILLLLHLKVWSFDVT